ncbi:MAG: MoxR family ATPase [Desulfohalobiaceae bacterium]|nr:MoxR family ATPase [Desulfohalobiaceae bacterium]
MNCEAGQTIIENVSRVFVGRQSCLELILTGLLAEGHVLIEDVPGLGKTLLAKSLARSIGGTFKRVQFTPDLLPADITGFNVFDQPSGRFVFHCGPVMTNVLLADEINRTIPRTQASLLESMQERQVTVDGTTYSLEAPFFVMATQNPIELEGTFPLPEAQLDRFLLKIKIGYPDRDQEIAILDRFQENDPLEDLQPVTSPAQVRSLQIQRQRVRLSSSLKGYIIDLVAATRNHPALRYGASPRGSLALLRTCQAFALLQGRDYVLPDDVKALAIPVLAHRLILTEEALLTGTTSDLVLQDILSRVLLEAPDGSRI